MSSIIPTPAQPVIPGDSGEDGSTQRQLVVERTVSDIVDSVAGAEYAPGRPSWQSRPCPPWCGSVHRERAYNPDRVHTAAFEPVQLSLYDDDSAGAGSEPADLELSATQHYRQAEPTVTAVVPTHERDDSRVTGWAHLDMTLDEARALRDRLSLILATLDGGHAPLDVELGECIDGAARRSVENATRLGEPFWSDVALGANLLQWTDGGSPSQVEVEIGIAGDSGGCTPEQARTIAQQLRKAADSIERLAALAAKLNETGELS